MLDSKNELFQTKIRFLGNEIYQGMKKSIQRSIEFVDKFFYEIKIKNNYKDF